MKTLLLILLVSCATVDHQAYWEHYKVTEIKRVTRGAEDKFFIAYENEHGLRLWVFSDDTTGLKIGQTVLLLTKR